MHLVQDKVASAYWKTSFKFLYTLTIWFQKQIVFMVIAVDNLNHDKMTIASYFHAVKELFVH